MALLGRDDLDAVSKSDTGDDLWQMVCSFEPAPGFRGAAAAHDQGNDFSVHRVLPLKRMILTIPFCKGGNAVFD